MKKLIFFAALTIFFAKCDKKPEPNYDWKDISIAGDVEFMSICMIDENTGYVGGFSKYEDINITEHYTTSNGYENIDTFMYQLDSNSFIYITYDIEPEDPGPCLFRTTDGGHTWTPISTPFKTGIINMCFVNRNTGFVVTYYDGVYRTKDGGASWDNVLSNTAYFGYNIIQRSPYEAVTFIDENNGFAYHKIKPILVSTNDGGDTWNCIEKIRRNGPQLHFTDGIKKVLFLSPDTGFIIHSNKLYRTQNAGLSWELVQEYIGNIYFLNTNNGYTMRGSDIYSTTNAGEDWNLTEYSSMGGTELFAPEQDLFYIFDAKYSEIYRQLIPGEQQLPEKMTLAKDEKLYDVSFPSLYIGYAVGNNGTILKYEGTVENE